MTVEIRLFNSLRRYGPARQTVEAGRTVADLVRRLGIPPQEIHVVLLNGRVIETADPRPLGPGDVLALSGPVPWSRGYGSAVV